MKKSELRQLIREEIQRVRLNEDTAESLKSAAMESDKTGVKELRQIVNAISGELMDQGLYENATVSIDESSIEISVPGADMEFIDNLEGQELSNIDVLNGKYFLDVVSSQSGSPGVSVKEFKNILDQVAATKLFDRRGY